MKNKKYKDIVYGILILLFGVFIGVVISLIVVDSGAKSNASNDGWLGFIGGMAGSIISGFIAIYILYINRKDAEAMSEENRKNAEEIQEQNHKEFISSKRQNSNILLYQVYKATGDELISLVSELIAITEDYYLNVADNTYLAYEDKVNRAKEIVFIIEMKLSALSKEKEQAKIIVDVIKKYCEGHIGKIKKYPRKKEDIVPSSEHIRMIVIEFYKNLLKIEI